MKPSITIVSGLPRSGTSMMMKVLESGGIQILTDNIRQADEDNLTGYYEYERVKQIKEDKEWLKDAEGKAVKLISALLKHLPNTYQYRILFMHREISEILASQKKMLKRRGENTDSVPDKTMAVLFQNHLIEVKAWLASQNNIKTLNVSYNEILKHPVSNIEIINKFLGGNLNKEKMIEVVDPTLYRQRKAG
jgi:broad-specificity NMP kinase